MKKSLRKLGVISLLVAVVVVMALSLGGCFLNESPQRRIERLTGIKFPKGMEVGYNYLAPGGFGGLQSQYTVFRLSEPPTSFLNRVSFFANQGVPFNSDSYFIAQIKAPAANSGNPVPDEYLFDGYARGSYLSYGANGSRMPGGCDSCSFSMAYFPDLLLLAVFISGH